MAQPLYATFWQRLAAAFIDGFIQLPVTMGLTYYSLIYVKSYLLSLTPTLVSLFYKCFLEKKYGATFGKKIMKIHVCSESLQALTLKEVYIRNYYYFLSLILAIIGYNFLYEMSDFQLATTFKEVWALKENWPMSHKIIRYTLVALFYIDSLLMFKSSKNQTLHDRLGKTLVVIN
jgi:uncharacterized RDD family membrane protein YckC